MEEEDIKIDDRYGIKNNLYARFQLYSKNKYSVLCFYNCYNKIENFSFEFRSKLDKVLNSL